jgi:hypothetical protein
MSTKEQQQQYRDRKSGKVITPTCSCGRILRADNQHKPLCAKCWRKTAEGRKKVEGYRKKKVVDNVD